MQLSESQYFIVIRFDVSLNQHHVGVVPEQDLAKIEWDGTTRISPAWELVPDSEAATLDGRLELEEGSVVCFVGPIDPQIAFDAQMRAVALDAKSNRIWMTLGHYNLVVFCKSEEVQEIRDFCDDHGCHAEFWSIVDQSDILDVVCDEIEYLSPEEISEPEKSLSPSLFEAQTHPAASFLDASIKQAFLEFYSLRQITLRRSSRLFRVLSDDAERISEMVPTLRDVLIGHEVAEDPTQKANIETNEALTLGERETVKALEYRDRVIGINAALSRQVSQAYSGVTPLIQTECHFWPHSLLGVGVASLALRNLAAFIIDCVNRSNFGYAYDARLNSTLEEIGLPQEDLTTLRLSKYEKLTLSCDVKEGDAEDNWNIPTPITYFSGRDGFRYGTYSVSAPLLCISGCNSKQWNLGTISHELSHRVVSHKFSLLLKKVLQTASETKCSSLKELLTDFDGGVEQAAVTLLMSSLTLEEALRLGTERFKRQKEDIPSFMQNAVLHARHELEEKIVHMFDYFHFYDMNSQEYVANIWQSWAIQPSIAEKFSSYIARTAVALSLNHIGAENWAELTYEDFLAAAEEHNFWHKTLFRQKLHTELASSKEKITQIVRRHWSTISLFQLIFKSQDLASRSCRENREIAKAKKLVLYDVTGLSFPMHTNPLHFVREATTDKVPSAARSAWLMSALAFRNSSPGE